MKFEDHLVRLLKVYRDKNYSTWEKKGPTQIGNLLELCPDREVDFLAEEPVTPSEWKNLMMAVVPDGYNRFDSRDAGDFLKNWEGKGGIKVFPAREGSVCCYVSGPLAVLNDIATLAHDAGADEAMLITEEMVGEPTMLNNLRLWWD